MPITVPEPVEGRIELSEIRDQMKLIIEAALPDVDVRIHREWKLRFDLGGAISLLQLENSDTIHSWMMGTAKLVVPSDDFEFVGNDTVFRQAQIDCWGFIDYVMKDPDSGLPAQVIIEREAERIADVLKANRNHMGFDVKPPGLKKVRPFQIENIDNHPFSEGVDVVVAQCSFRVDLNR